MHSPALLNPGRSLQLCKILQPSGAIGVCLWAILPDFLVLIS
ncbi:MAG: hypothetical protein ACAF42_08000 [Limnothrix sp. BL-A-16]